MGGNLDQQVAEGEIVAGEAPFLRPEDESYAAAAIEFLLDARGKIGEGDYRLLRAAIGEGSGAGDQGALRQRLFQAPFTLCVLEQFFRTYRGPGLAPVRLVRRDDSKMQEAEVGHSPRRRSYIEGVARGDKDNIDAVAMGFGEQAMIVAESCR